MDWPIILGRRSRSRRSSTAPCTASWPPLLAAFDEILALDEPDAILRRAVELALERIGLKRAGIFLLDRAAEC